MLVAALGWVLAQGDLAWNLSLGDSWRYRLEQSFLPMENASKEDEQAFVYEGSTRVTGVKVDSFDFETRQRLVEHRFGGDKLPPPQGSSDWIASATFMRSGLRQYEWERYADEVEFRLARLLWFVFPSGDVSSRWNAEFPAIRPDWGAAASASYTFQERGTLLGRTVRSYLFRFSDSGPPKPMTAKGTMHVDVASGLLLAADIEAADAPLPGGLELQRLKLRYHVIEAKLKASPPHQRDSR